jgi:hypothetical protein
MNDYLAPQPGDQPCRWCKQRIRYGRYQTDERWFHVLTGWDHCGFTYAEPEATA